MGTSAPVSNRRGLEVGAWKGSRRKGEGRCTRRHTGCTEELCFLVYTAAAHRREAGYKDAGAQATNGARD
jgi:hypothetical protein